MGKGKKKRQKEKELLEERQIRFQIYESLDRYHSNHSDNAFGNRHGGAELD